MFKKLIVGFLVGLLLLTAAVSCSSKKSTTSLAQGKESVSNAASKKIDLSKVIEAKEFVDLAREGRYEKGDNVAFTFVLQEDAIGSYISMEKIESSGFSKNELEIRFDHDDFTFFIHSEKKVTILDFWFPGKYSSADNIKDFLSLGDLEKDDEVLIEGEFKKIEQNDSSSFQYFKLYITNAKARKIN